MKFAFSTLGCPELNLEEIVDTAGRYAYGGVELRGQDREHVDPSYRAGERTWVRRLFTERNLEIIGVTAYTRFAFLDRHIRSTNEELLLSYVELAADLGARYVRTFVGTWEQGLDLESIREAVGESLNRVAEAIAGTPVTVLLETHDSMSRVQDLAPILTRVASSKMGVLWDIAHSYLGGEPLQKSLELIGKRLGYVHLKDIKSGPDGVLQHCPPGQGDIPLVECRQLLMERGFQGWLCLEWERKWHPELPPIHEVLEHFRKIMTGGNK